MEKDIIKAAENAIRLIFHGVDWRLAVEMAAAAFSVQETQVASAIEAICR